MLEDFWRKNRDAGIDVLGVTKLYDRSDDPGDIRKEVGSVRDFLAERSVTYPNVVAAYDSPAHRSYRADSVPVSVLVIQPLAGTRIVGEYQRLDGHRHRAVRRDRRFERLG